MDGEAAEGPQQGGQTGKASTAGYGFILTLDRIRSGMLAEVGGKAANLGEMSTAGLPVPPGFCLTTAAYCRALDGAALGEVLAALDGTDVVDYSLDALAARARSVVLAAGVPPEVAEEVRTAYNRLGPEVPVAVRSSATAEDLPFASFAGQQDTFLNVVGVDAVLDAVSRCWASLWTDRAVSYRTAHGIRHSTVALAVVVQQMIDAATAGVMFTANPLTGRRQEAVIDASPGLGEAVVSGAVNPDQYVVDIRSRHILTRTIGDRRVEIRPLPGGGTERIEHSGQLGKAGLDAAAIGTDGEVSRVEPCLTDHQIRALAALGDRVEQHYAAPQDTEWAMDRDGKLWLTQARPITTLYPRPTRTPSSGGEHAFLNFSLAQGLTRPLTPMGLAGIRLIASCVARRAGFDVPDPRTGPSPYYEAGQRIFFDITSVLRSRVGRALAPRIFDIMEARSAALIRRLSDDPRFAMTNKTPFKLIRHVAPVAARYRVPETVLRGLFRPAAAMRQLDKVSQDLKDAFDLPVSAASHQRLQHVEQILGERIFATVPQVLPLPALGFALLALVRKLLGPDVSYDELQTVIRGLPHNVTTEMDLALWELASKIGQDPEAVEFFVSRGAAELAEAYKAGGLPARPQAGLERFLAEYGDRAVAEIDIGMPRWSEEPTHILGVLGNYLRLGQGVDGPGAGGSPRQPEPTPQPDPARQFENAATEAEDQVARLVARGRTKSALHAAVIRFALDRTRRYAGLRELPKYNLVLGLAEARRHMVRIGRELAEAGRLDEADDVFFLDFKDVELALAGTGFQQVVAERRQDYDRELQRRHIPRMLLSDGTEPEAVVDPGAKESAANASAGVLTGSAASTGTVTGLARVVMDPVGAHLEPGEILVAPSTDPGWTPLFLTAGGLVMEMGGPNSHGAVVAREYGIPAVVGVPDATVRIATGQRITVDGASGTVTPA
ncbi:PEP/pyruvate-binding domain-containing protein [Paenarthrobacter ureafaciens]|jgi:pyruvate,water dikinase|uniref:PEP/pyruvate-binding domain-containing protein n=1 Tax=Paenarthrobacter ureafaciens TaxID=37931 RepID=UPI00140D6F2C